MPAYFHEKVYFAGRGVNDQKVESEFGGIERYTAAMADLLSQEGNQVFVLASEILIKNPRVAAWLLIFNLTSRTAAFSESLTPRDVCSHSIWEFRPWSKPPRNKLRLLITVALTP